MEYDDDDGTERNGFFLLFHHHHHVRSVHRDGQNISPGQTCTRESKNIIFFLLLLLSGPAKGGGNCTPAPFLVEGWRERETGGADDGHHSEPRSPIDAVPNKIRG